MYCKRSCIENYLYLKNMILADNFAGVTDHPFKIKLYQVKARDLPRVNSFECSSPFPYLRNSISDTRKCNQFLIRHKDYILRCQIQERRAN